MMKHFRILTVAVLIMALFAGLSAAAETTSKGSIEQYFQKARQDYLQKDMKAAAEDVHKAAAFLKSEAAAAKSKGKEALTASYREMEKLAGELEKGTVKSVKEIEMPFARAYEALARDSHVKSMEAWSKKEFQKTGDELEAAVREVEKGYAWTGQKMEAGTEKVIGESKELSRKLKEGAGWTSTEARKILKDMENEIRTLGRRISSK